MKKVLANVGTIVHIRCVRSRNRERRRARIFARSGPKPRFGVHDPERVLFTPASNRLCQQRATSCDSDDPDNRQKWRWSSRPAPGDGCKLPVSRRTVMRRREFGYAPGSEEAAADPHLCLLFPRTGKAVAFTKEAAVKKNMRSPNGPEIQKELLLGFWGRFNGRKNNGVGFDASVKLEALKALAAIVIPYVKQQAIAARRDKFNEAKVKLHPWRRFGFCFVCGSPATSRHHVIQLQNGGINAKKNLVSLCSGCHAEIHPWLRI